MKFGISALFILLILSFSCVQKSASEKLLDQINTLFENEAGKFSLAYKNLNSGEILLINEKENFHAASTMKTPVMIELYKQANQGKFNLNDSILIKDEFYSIVDSSTFKMDIGVDSEARLYSLIGKKLTIKDLMFEMITMSSNLATNILIDLVDAKKVTQSMRDMGAMDIQILRGVEDLKAFDLGLNNTTNSYDLMNIYEKMALNEIVSKEACDEMIQILTAQHFNEIIPMHLPKDVTVAHKTGSITGVHHDSGIVYLPNGDKYVLVLLSKELGDFDSGTALLANISKMIYDYQIR